MDTENSTSRPGLPGISIIVAMTAERVIGSGEQLPWQLPADLQLFKRLTTGGILIMGRKTFRSIGRPLPGRHNIVLSRTLQELPGAQVCNSFMAGMTEASRLGRPVYVIGGEDVYGKALPIASELHISLVEGSYAGDRYFPWYDKTEWQISESAAFPGFKYLRCQRRTAG